jgi:diguanylate cyclase (GGDEF)-like protein/PAS domain S-box-containing protein
MRPERRAHGAERDQGDFVRRLVELSFELACSRGLDDALRLACERLEELTGAEGVSIRLFEHGELAVRAATGCATEASGHTQQTCFPSVLSAPLERERETIGSIDLCSSQPDAFDAVARQTVELAGVAVVNVLDRAAVALSAADDARTIFAAAPIGIMRMEVPRGAVTANPALQRMLGYSVAELVERGLEEYPPGQDEPVRTQLFDRLIENAFDPWACDSYQVEKRLGRKYGPPVWTQVTAKLTRNSDGRPAYGLAMIEDISRRKDAEEALKQQAESSRHQALHDPLTGLANRMLFSDRIQHATLHGRRDDSSLAVLIMDVDRFKEINDSLGHPAGDAFLHEVGSRLAAVVRASDTVARLGGDEFGLLLPGRSRNEVDAVIARIVEAVERPVLIEGIPLVVEASIGVACFPEDGVDVDTLLRQADVAMYAAKRANLDVAFYDPTADVHDRDRLTLVGELRRAIEERELALDFQPKALLAGGNVRSVEALLRWRHPERGLVMPDDFIPLAQETSLMGPLTLYVVEEALRRACEWQEQGLTLAVAVNLSHRDLLEPRFPEQVEKLLQASGANPGLLEMEITESALSSDPARLGQVLRRLSGLGIRLSIDDFGTGYSSLSHLTRLPISEIKIDRSFVARMKSEPDAAAIVRSVIELAKSLRLDVVAEGVESEEIWQQLESLGCTFAQGHFLSPPLSAEELPRWVAKRGMIAAAA